ncbi:MAG TPA: hypothetical protein VG103_01275, partial [Chthoniobacterales bacterium]|nr:hypothetical protein [Chthoniobacterales bacterium]
MRQRNRFGRYAAVSVIIFATSLGVGDAATVPLTIPPAGSGDFSRLTIANGSELFTPPRDPVAAVEQLRQLVRRAAAEHRKVSVAGARHSMGGHTLI